MYFLKSFTLVALLQGLFVWGTAQAAYYSFSVYYKQDGGSFSRLSGDPGAAYGISVKGASQNGRQIQVDFDYNGRSMWIKGVANTSSIDITEVSDPAISGLLPSRRIPYKQTGGKYYLKTIYWSKCSCTVWLGF